MNKWSPQYHCIYTLGHSVRNVAKHAGETVQLVKSLPYKFNPQSTQWTKTTKSKCDGAPCYLSAEEMEAGESVKTTFLSKL